MGVEGPRRRDLRHELSRRRGPSRLPLPSQVRRRLVRRVLRPVPDEHEPCIDSRPASRRSILRPRRALACAPADDEDRMVGADERVLERLQLERVGRAAPGERGGDARCEGDGGQDGLPSASGSDAITWPRVMSSTVSRSPPFEPASRWSTAASPRSRSGASRVPLAGIGGAGGGRGRTLAGAAAGEGAGEEQQGKACRWSHGVAPECGSRDGVPRWILFCRRRRGLRETPAAAHAPVGCRSWSTRFTPT